MAPVGPKYRSLFVPTAFMSCLSSRNWMDTHAHCEGFLFWASVDPLREELKQRRLRRWRSWEPRSMVEKRSGACKLVGKEKQRWRRWKNMWLWRRWCSAGEWNKGQTAAGVAAGERRRPNVTLREKAFDLQEEGKKRSSRSQTWSEFVNWILMMGCCLFVYYRVSWSSSELQEAFVLKNRWRFPFNNKPSSFFWLLLILLLLHQIPSFVLIQVSVLKRIWEGNSL